jgi:hypothetical protein
MWSSSAFWMALDAQLIGGIERHHSWIVSRAASSVTAQTLHRQVLVPRVKHLISDWMGRMALPFMAPATKVDTDRGLAYEQNLVGSMRGVAAYAIARFYRLTQILIVWIFL